MAKVVSVNISEKKGTLKKPVPEIKLKLRHGIVGDAHAGDWHRQISLLAEESIDTMRPRSPIALDPGVFAENINTEGIDLKHLPVRSGAADVVLNVFSPADYTEFRRVLAPDGELIKVVPGPDYLCEVREAVSGYLRGGAYDNASVLAHLRAHADVLSETPVRSVASLTSADSRDFLRMTPLTFSVPAEALEEIMLEKITIDVRVLRCRMR